MLNEEITVTIYRAAQQGILPGMGVEEDALQVKIVRGATVRTLKDQICNLYGLPHMLQVIRRDIDGPPLADTEGIACDDDDVLHLSAGGGPAAGLLGSLGSLGGLGNLDGLMNAVNGAMADVTNAMGELERTEYTLNVVMLAQPQRRRPEKRCSLVVVAVARVEEVLEMAKAELDVSDDALLEFAGEKLSPGAPIHALGLRDGDTVMLSLVPKGATAL